jgi:outer membrane scaffolding protein for murein synthesis (MipA/OmpV family)
MSEQFGIGTSEAARDGLEAYDPDADFKDRGVGVIADDRLTDRLSATGRGT